MSEILIYAFGFLDSKRDTERILRLFEFQRRKIAYCIQLRSKNDAGTVERIQMQCSFVHHGKCLVRSLLIAGIVI